MCMCARVCVLCLYSVCGSGNIVRVCHVRVCPRVFVCACVRMRYRSVRACVRMRYRSVRAHAFERARVW